MNKKIILQLALVFLTVLFLNGISIASIPNAFVSTDGNSNGVNINFTGNGLTPGWYFGVFDLGADPTTGLDLLYGRGGVLFETGSFTVSSDSSGYTITVIQGVDDGQTLNIGPTGDFSFYFRDDNNNYDTSFDISGSEPTFFFESTKGGHVVGVDLAPSAVPIPGSSILLLSGLIGLVALGGRRMAKS